MIAEASARSGRIREADEYLNARTGHYRYRCARYDAALGAMWGTVGGVAGDRCPPPDQSTVIDVGSGWSEFGRRMYEDRFLARYIPVDACIDGTDLETWVPPRSAEFFVCLEVLEHLQRPARLIEAMQEKATGAVIISTPNPETTDVLGMDPTHKTPVTLGLLVSLGFRVEQRAFYGQAADSLFGVWRRNL